MKIQKVIYKNDHADFCHIKHLFEEGLEIYSRKELFRGEDNNSLIDLINKYPLTREKVKKSKNQHEIQDFIKEYHWGIKIAGDKSIEIADGVFNSLEDYIEEFLYDETIKIRLIGHCQGDIVEFYIDKESVKIFGKENIEKIFTDYFFDGENYLHAVITDLYGQIDRQDITEFLEHYEKYTPEAKAEHETKKNDYESLSELFDWYGYTFLSDDYPEALKEYDEEFTYS